ncbi:MAG: hypothetical protein U0638_15070 [Phycisphaerales bacterium]
MWPLVEWHTTRHRDERGDPEIVANPPFPTSGSRIPGFPTTDRELSLPGHQGQATARRREFQKQQHQLRKNNNTHA